MDLVGILTQFAYILPLFIVIYQLGRVISEHYRMAEDIRKLQEADKETNSKIEDVKASTDTALSAILTQLNTLSISIARIETTINIHKINKETDNKQ